MSTAFVNVASVLKDTVFLKDPNATRVDLASQRDKVQNLLQRGVAFHMNLDPTLLTHSTRTIHQAR